MLFDAPREPRFSSNGKSFFVPEGFKTIGSGLQLWRGFFQYVPTSSPSVQYEWVLDPLYRTSPRSVRPTLGKMVINVDISTGLMYANGPLLTIAMAYLRCQGHNRLEDPMREPERRALSKFLDTVRIVTKGTHPANAQLKPRGIKRVMPTGAYRTKFKLGNGQEQTVQEYYETTYHKRLQYPKVVCVEVNSLHSFFVDAAYSDRLPGWICLLLPGRHGRLSADGDLRSCPWPDSQLPAASRVNQGCRRVCH